ncbi:hypothetical protein [Sulfuriflexus sp.]|uniref:hypothetical protein n=1 Tax=Sulfuriflexus sp. TaxID=2015443 RepID=UPI0028CD4BD1|nr:hypothetical protein [Sulfuriflexus sp.]MDT8404393.1 hypothetical protein [Sulfuriflexus sp.]
MDSEHRTCIKHREIHFCSLHARGRAPAHAAMLLLADVEGIIGLRPVSATCLRVSYDLRNLSLQITENALIEVGFHLDNSLFNKLRRSLYYYTEETQCENMGHVHDSKQTRDIFIERYQRLPHGCRDDRPDHWRKYL